MVRSALFEGDTWHARKTPVANDFRYRVYTWLIDLDEIDQLDRDLRLLSVNRRGVCSLRDEDHVIAPNKRAALDWLNDNGVDLTDGRIQLQTSPRVFGYTFNPISLWWCWDASDELRCVIAEVHNTYGGRHAYLLEPDQGGRVETTKEFYVSPFYEVNGKYTMRFSPPGHSFKVHIGYDQDDKRVFDATWSGTRRPTTDRSVAKMLLKYPLVTLKVMALIHLQGIKLWFRGLKVIPRTAHARGGH